MKILIFILSFLALIFRRALSSSSSSSECQPRNWKFSWYKVENTWYTTTKCEGTWAESVEKCKNIELGRTSIARIANQKEHDQLVNSDVVAYYLWIGGIRAQQSSKWFWFSNDGLHPTLHSVNKSFWAVGEPNNKEGIEGCIRVTDKSSQRLWDDGDCSNKYRALCELRCWFSIFCFCWIFQLFYSNLFGGRGRWKLSDKQAWTPIGRYELSMPTRFDRVWLGQNGCFPLLTLQWATNALIRSIVVGEIYSYRKSCMRHSCTLFTTMTFIGFTNSDVFITWIYFQYYLPIFRYPGVFPILRITVFF